MSVFPAPLPADIAQLRPIVYAEVDKLSAQSLLLLHRGALQLELEEVTERLNAGFDADGAAGRLERQPEIIREARAALHSRQSS